MAVCKLLCKCLKKSALGLLSTNDMLIDEVGATSEIMKKQIILWKI